MTVKQQFQTIKNNWLILLIVLVVIISLAGFNSVSTISNTFASKIGAGYAYDSVANTGLLAERAYYPSPSSGISPQAEERSIVKTAYLGIEVERDRFDDKEARLKQVATTTHSLITYENKQVVGEGLQAYTQGTYTLRTPVAQYNTAITSLKELGKVQSVSDNSVDITEEKISTQDQLDIERARLQRYRDLLTQATRVEDKLTISDRIADQERTIKWLEDSLTNIDEQVEYSTISITLTEEQSAFSGAAFITIGQIVQSFLGSVASLITLVIVLLPWVVIILIIWGIVRVVRKK